MAKSDSLVEIYLTLLDRRLKTGLNILPAAFGGGIDYEQEMDKIIKVLAYSENRGKAEDLQNLISALRKKLAEKDKEIEQLKTENESLKRGNFSTDKRRPNLETQRKIERLAAIREEARLANRQIPKKVAACDTAGITTKTVRHHASKLWKNWDDKNYQWQGEDWE